MHKRPFRAPIAERGKAVDAFQRGEGDFFLISLKAVEERVLELHEEKRRISEDVLEGAGATRLTPEALMRLFV